MAERGASYEEQRDGAAIRVYTGEQVVRVAVSPSWPGLAPAPHPHGFVSAAMLVHKAKQMDDGLYAAVEIAAQEGVGTKRGKKHLLARVLERWQGGGPARATIEAAALLGGARRTPPSALAQALADALLADPLRGSPLGFYTWTEDLSRIFRQDRMLQRDLSLDEDVAALAAAIADDAEARAIYERTLGLVERLTNALAWSDLRALFAPRGAGGVPRKLSFAPPSRAHETDLVKQLYGHAPVPEGFDLCAELAKRVRAGEIDLTPREDSGWYDVQTWALETLVAPDRAVEASRLELDPTYVRHLEELFRAVITSTRETHVKQLDVPVAGAAPPRVVDVVVSPRLTVEPLPTYYERRADAYRFVRALLVETFGEDALASMRGPRAGGFAKHDLRTELDDAIRLFDGAAATSLRELGLPTSRDGAPFEAWARTPDPDLAADARVMVPVYHDVERKKTKVWLIVGWATEWLDASFAKPPRVEVLGGAPAKVRFAPRRYPLTTPVMIEMLVTRVLDRDELRALCDRHRTLEEIVAALG
jgi:hypothetical protein